MASGGGGRRYKEECWEPDAMDEDDDDDSGGYDEVDGSGGEPPSSGTSDQSTKTADDEDDEGIWDREEGSYEDQDDWGLKLDPASVPRAPSPSNTTMFTNAFSFPHPTLTMSSSAPFMQQQPQADNPFFNQSVGQQQQNAGNFASSGMSPYFNGNCGSSERGDNSWSSLHTRSRSRSRSRSPNYSVPFVPYRRPKRYTRNVQSHPTPEF